MKVLFVSSECADFAKSGGLADVAAALPRALRAQGVDVRLLMPGYPDVLKAAGGLVAVASLPARGEISSCLIGEMQTCDGLPVYTVLAPSLYQRPGSLYAAPSGEDFADNDVRFARLGLAAAEIACGRPSMDWQPDLVHCHDWHAGLAPAYMAWMGAKVSSITTIHNIAYQGLYPAERLTALGIPQEAFNINRLEFYDKISFLKAGLAYATHVTTVSPTYAKELLTEEYGGGLHGFLQGLAERTGLTGILNGIDDGWDPASDPYLYAPFSEKDIGAKKDMKRRMTTGLCLKKSNGPLFGIVARLVPQKGFDLLAAIAPEIVNRGGQIAILGVGDPNVEQMLAGLVREHRGDIALLNGFNEVMAHRIMAASDFYLMPSRFEPCGLSQMHALRYGAIPIAHATGGLVDTIEDGTTGFLFDSFSTSSFMHAINRAFAAYHRPEILAHLQKAAMSRRFDWSAAAEQYGRLYSALTGLALPSRIASVSAPAKLAPIRLCKEDKTLAKPIQPALPPASQLPAA